MAANGISTLATKELRQVAKLDLAAAKRGETPLIDYLPTQYTINSVTNNANPLITGRPWQERMELSGAIFSTSFLSLATTWDGSSMPFSGSTLEQNVVANQPVLVGEYLEFITNDFVFTQEPEVMEIALSAEYEISVIYKPGDGALVDGYIWSFGNSSINNENTLQLRALSNGQLRYLIDGNLGIGANSFTTTMTPMVANGEYLITLIYSGNSISIRVNGVTEINNVDHTGPLPVGIDTFAVGCRTMIGNTNFISGGIKMIEVVGL
jgi:hypothetical protein